MTGPSDLVPPSERPERGSWAKVVSSAPSDVEAWPGAGWQLLSGPSLRAGAALELQSEAVMGGLTAAEQASKPVATGAASLDLTEWTMGSSAVVSVTGEVDIATTGQLSGALGGALRRGPEGLICDLSGVSFLGAAGLTALLVARRRAIACHAWFDLVCPQPLPRRVIALAGLDAVLSLHDHVAEAAAAQARREGRPGLATGGAPGAGRDRPDGGKLARRLSFRCAFRPALTFKGQQFKGLRGFSGQPLQPDAIAYPEISEAAVLAGRLRS